LSVKRAKKAVPKTWVKIRTPKYLGEKVLGDAQCFSMEELKGKKLDALLYDITGDPAHSFVKFSFKVVGVENGECVTEYWGHEISRDYLSSILRKGSSRVDSIFDVTTKDGFALRLRATMVTRFKVSASKKTMLRAGLKKIITEKVTSLTLGQFAQEIATGKTESDMYNFAKKLIRVKFTGIAKAKVLKKIRDETSPSVP
jgi:small subunit ribosomal protein S3Ae